MKEEWLLQGAIVPVDVETTTALVAEIHRLIGVVGGIVLAQSEQEPVAWMTINEYGEEDDIHYENPEGHLLEGWTYKPLYTRPPTVRPERTLEYWNAVEGWVKIDEVREHFNSVGCGTIYKTAGEGRAPLYTSPPAQRTWVSLTDEEITKLHHEIKVRLMGTYKTEDIYRAIEAKLREKNT